MHSSNAEALETAGNVCRWLRQRSSGPQAQQNNLHAPQAITEQIPQQTGLQVLGRCMLITLLTALFYYYPSLLATTLSLFACYRLDRVTPLDGVGVLHARVSRVL